MEQPSIGSNNSQFRMEEFRDTLGNLPPAQFLTL
jgi:hypothetical protein